MDSTALFVAAIAAVPATVAACAAWVSANANGRHIGRSNGQGTVVEMLEGNIKWQERHAAQDRRVAKFLGVPEHLLDND